MLNINKDSREAKSIRKGNKDAKSKLLFVVVSSVVMALFFVAIILNINSTPSTIAQSPVPVVQEEKESEVIDNVADTAIEEQRSFAKREQRREKEARKNKNKKEKNKPEIKAATPATASVKENAEAQWVSCKTSGEKKEYYLPDNSKISLGPNSEIKYAGNFKESRILYFSGSAFFEITHKNNDQPFIIYSNVAKTEVLGTSFTIKSLKGESADVINVLTGKVAYSAQKDPSRIIYLTTGKECTIKEKEDDRLTYSTIDIDEGAKHEKIIFNNTKLSEVIHTLQGFYQVSIATSTPEILSCKFTGTFENSDIDEVMRVLSESFNLSLSQEEGKYVLKGNSCSK